jgi:hypothetical protein
MASDLQLVHLAFNRVKELPLKYGHSIPHLISSFQRTCDAGLPFKFYWLVARYDKLYSDLLKIIEKLSVLIEKNYKELLFV